MRDRAANANMEIHTGKNVRTKNWKNVLSILLKKNTSQLMKNKSHRPNTDDVLLWGHSLEHLLSHKYGRAAFLVFLKSEFCEENLEFWWKCEEFRTLTKHKELKSQAQNIYREFIQSEAPKEINLDFQTRNGIVQNLPEPTQTLFIPAQRKVYSLMENNSYPRFLQSDFYKDLCTTAKGDTRDMETQSKSKDMETQTKSKDMGTKSKNMETQSKSKDMETQSKSKDMITQSESKDMETQSAFKA